MGFVYILHFDKPYKHARHYIGYAEESVEDRIETHKKGQGARLMEVIVKAGIGFTVAKVYSDVDRHFERRLKNKGGAARNCPLCINNKTKAMSKLIITKDIVSILTRRHPHPVPHPNEGMDNHHTSWEILVTVHFPVVGQTELQQEVMAIRKDNFKEYMDRSIDHALQWMNRKLDQVRNELKVVKRDGTTFLLDPERISELGLSPVGIAKLAEYEKTFIAAVDAIEPLPPLWDADGNWLNKEGK